MKKAIRKWESLRLMDATFVIGHQVDACQNKVGGYMILQLFDIKE
jgi:hypothetical protein